MNNQRWEVIPDEHDPNEETVSADTLFADIMEGFDYLKAGRVTFHNAQTDDLRLREEEAPEMEVDL